MKRTKPWLLESDDESRGQIDTIPQAPGAVAEMEEIVRSEWEVRPAELETPRAELEGRVPSLATLAKAITSRTRARRALV